MSADSSIVVEPLRKHHDRSGFSCGVDALDDYLRRRAGQDMRRGISRAFVYVSPRSDRVRGFYTLSAVEIDVGSLPDDLARRLPRQPVPAALVGRLAVDLSEQGRGIGGLLLADAIKRTLQAREQVAIYAIVVDAKDEEAGRYYQAFGFRRLINSPSRLFFPLTGL